MLIIFLRIAWRNVFYNSKKSLLAILAVSTCFFSLNIFQGYIRGSDAIFLDSYSKRSMLGDILVKKIRDDGQVSSSPMEDESDLLMKNEQQFLVSYLQNNPSVENFTRFIRMSGSLSNGKQSAVVMGYAYDVVSGEKMRVPGWEWNTLAGEPLANDQEAEILLGTNLARLLGCEIDTSKRFITGQGGYTPENRPFKCENLNLQFSASTIDGQANAKEFHIRGIVDAMFRELDMRFFYIPFSQGSSLLNTEGYSFATLRLKSGENKEAFISKMKFESQKNGVNLQIRTWQQDEAGEFYKKTMSFLYIFRNFMVIVILGVALLSIFNTFFRNIQERTREIGVLQTLGFRFSQIRNIFIMETFLLTCFGVGIGASGAIVFSQIINKLSLLYKIGLLTQPVPFLIYLSPQIMVGSVIVVFLISHLAICPPLFFIKRRSITDSLTYT